MSLSLPPQHWDYKCTAILEFLGMFWWLSWLSWVLMLMRQALSWLSSLSPALVTDFIRIIYVLYNAQTEKLMDFDKFVPNKPPITIKKQTWCQKVPNIHECLILLTFSSRAFWPHFSPSWVVCLCFRPFWDGVVLEIIFCVCLSVSRHCLVEPILIQEEFHSRSIPPYSPPFFACWILFVSLASLKVTWEMLQFQTAYVDSNVQRAGKTFFSGLLESS